MSKFALCFEKMHKVFKNKAQGVLYPLNEKKKKEKKKKKKKMKERKKVPKRLRPSPHTFVNLKEGRGNSLNAMYKDYR